MARPATPPSATKALVAELRSQGVDCSSRRLEDWRRVGLVLRQVAELLPALLAPVVVQLRRVAARLLADVQDPDLVALALLSQGHATMEPMTRPRRSGQAECEARSA